MKSVVCRLMVVVGALVPGLAHAEGSAAAGAQKIKTAGCISCHGRDGLSKLPEAPNLAGQVDIYIVSSLKAYHSGERKNEIMNTVAQTLSEGDMADLAAYYSGIKISVTPPPKP
ncbi:c-type cytochrome [Lichenibacterium ramalinae]|uniref:Cytochrome c n=1 Tax=Lichenibacterium ramalinae TaxID=2316527 RepID=A0A4Q2RFK6_9HYPH|nr:cytochrome c [Lichenibacterium ramalinae]RYB05179.1 cytochrome c [Lichenibacterium ramalinae]